MRQQQRKASGRFVMPGAIAISIALHALLLLISLWVPIGRQATAAEEPEEAVLRFTFAPPSEEDVEGGDLPPSDAPTFDEPEPVIDPDYRPEGQPSLDTPSSEAPVESPELPFEEEPVPLEEPPPEPQERPEVVEPPVETPSADIVPRERGEFRPPVPERERAETGQKRLDVDRALEDFSRALRRARAAQPPPDGGGSASNVFVPDLSAIPGSGFGVGNLMFESRDYDWTDYARQIYVAIWRAWHHRLYQTTNDFEKWAHANDSWYLNHQNQVRFVIERSGQVTGIVLEGGSGCGPLDASALEALEEVILPPLPDDFPRDQEVVHARFIAQGEIRALRPALARLKRFGYF